MSVADISSTMMDIYAPVTTTSDIPQVSPSNSLSLISPIAPSRSTDSPSSSRSLSLTPSDSTTLFSAPSSSSSSSSVVSSSSSCSSSSYLANRTNLLCHTVLQSKDLLAVVYDFLDLKDQKTCRLVCKYWYRAIQAFHTSFWRWKALPTLPKVPCARRGHSATFIPSSGEVIIHGGAAFDSASRWTHLNDLHSYDTTRALWKEIQPAGPDKVTRPPSSFHSSTLVGNSLYMFGGYYYDRSDGRGKEQDRMSIFDLTSKRWYHPKVSGDMPHARESHTATLLGDGNRLVIFGGMYEERVCLNDVYVFDVRRNHFECIKMLSSSDSTPCPRFGHSATLLPDDSILVFGGCATFQHSVKPFADMYILHTHSRHDMWSWERIEPTATSSNLMPAGRRAHSAVMLDKKNVLVFGGILEGLFEQNNDCFVLNLDRMQWVPSVLTTKPPIERYGHTMTSIGKNRFFLFGGSGKRKIVMNDCIMLFPWNDLAIQKSLEDVDIREGINDIYQQEAQEQLQNMQGVNALDLAAAEAQDEIDEHYFGEEDDEYAEEDNMND